MLRYVTSGESHGKCLTAILEGLPAGLEIDRAFIDLQLRRRQLGYGRGGRMQIEKDEIDITAGVRHGRTLGSPIAFLIRNRDWSHWELPMSPDPVPEGTNVRALTKPRPGHVDLAGSLKYQTHDARDVLERASARETAARVGVGAFCTLFLRRFGIEVGSGVLAVGEVDASDESAMKECIDRAKSAGDTVGGILEAVATGVPPGLGSHTQWDRKLDGQLAQALMSIPAVKAVEIGDGVAAARAFGSQVHDEIFYDAGTKRFYRETNRAGGLEAGVTNGQEVRARLYLKPIPTLRKPLRSADLVTKEAFEAAFERSDTCVVPAAAVIAESAMAFVLARAFIEKFGGDSIVETEAHYRHYQSLLTNY